MAPTSTMKMYFENLDALRFFAFLLVFVSHAALFLGFESASPSFVFLKDHLLVNGDAGVAFFFVLSGFLITYLLFKEEEARGSISLLKFYARRILRIWPVYFLTLFIGFFVLPLFLYTLIGSETLPFLANPPLSALPRYISFMANFALAFHGGASVPTDILWSISVEEQFYLVWPLIVIFVPRKYLGKVLVGIIMIASVYRYTHAYTFEAVLYSTFSVMSDLAVGCLLAWCMVERKQLVQLMHRIRRGGLVCIYLLLAVLLTVRHSLYAWAVPRPALYSVFAVTLPLLLSILYALIVFEQNESLHSFWKAGKSRVLSSLGKMSYGLYAYHMISFAIILALARVFGLTFAYTSLWQWVSFALISFGGTYLLARASQKWMELPIQKLRSKLQ